MIAGEILRLERKKPLETSTRVALRGSRSGAHFLEVLPGHDRRQTAQRLHLVTMTAGVRATADSEQRVSSRSLDGRQQRAVKEVGSRCQNSISTVNAGGLRRRPERLRRLPGGHAAAMRGTWQQCVSPSKGGPAESGLLREMPRGLDDRRRPEAQRSKGWHDARPR